MSALRKLSWAALTVGLLHLVFGAIVRISGSGMGCGDHWPKCYGRWFPPMNRPDLIIEVSHRYLASILLLACIVLAVAAWRLPLRVVHSVSALVFAVLGVLALLVPA